MSDDKSPSMQEEIAEKIAAANLKLQVGLHRLPGRKYVWSYGNALVSPNKEDLVVRYIALGSEEEARPLREMPVWAFLETAEPVFLPSDFVESA